MSDIYTNAGAAFQPGYEPGRQPGALRLLRAVAQLAGLVGAAAALALRLYACNRRRRRAERQLMALDERTLKDIGLARGDIHSAVASVQPRPNMERASFRPDRLG